MTGVSSIASTAKGRAGLCTVDGLRRMTGITENLINELQLLLGVAQDFRGSPILGISQSTFYAANQVKLFADELTCSLRREGRQIAVGV